MGALSNSIMVKTSLCLSLEEAANYKSRFVAVS